MTLRLWTNGFDTYVAETPADIPAMYEKTTHNAYDADEMGDWTERIVDGTLTIMCSDRADGDDLVTKTVAEWIADNGPGFLCSTEY